MKKKLLNFILLSFLHFATWGQATGDYRTQGVGGNWNTLTTWQRYNGATWVTPTVPQGYPGQNAGTGVVTILSGHTATLNVSPVNAVVSVVLSATSIINVTAGNTLSVSNNWTNNGGTFNPGTGTVTFSGNGARSINGTAASQQFNNLIVNKTGGGSLTVAGSTTTLTLTGSATLTAGTFIAGTAAMINVAGNWTNNGAVFTAGTGAVTCNGVTQAIGGTAATTFNLLIISNSSATTFAVNTNVSSDLTVSSGSLTIGNDNTNRTITVTRDINIVVGASFLTAGNGGNVLNIGRNVINNGTFDMRITAATATVVFNGAANQTVSGTGAITDFNLITINNSGAANNNIVEVTSSNLSAAAGFLTLTDGIFKLSGTAVFTNIFFNTATPTINADEGIWLNNPNVTVTAQNGTTQLSGLIRISAGTYNIGTATDESLEYNAGASLIMEGGALNISGGFYETNLGAEAITYFQNGGVVTLNKVGTAVASFSISTTTSNFTMAGGSIVFEEAALLNYLNFAATYSVTGGTIQFGNTLTPANSFFSLSTTPPVFNLTVAATNNPTLWLGSLTGPTTVLNDVTIGGVLDANTLSFFLNEDLIVGRHWINNGFFNPGPGTVTFNSTSQAQTIGGTVNTTFYNLTNTNSNATGVSLLRDATVSNILNLASSSNGKFTIGANNLTISTGGTITGPTGTRYIVSIPTSAVNGRLRQNNLATAARLFPIGTASNYLPLTITPAIAGSDFSSSVFTGTTTDGLPGGPAFGNRTFQANVVWRVDRPAGVSNAHLRMDWLDATLEGANFTTLGNASIGIWRNTGTGWTLIPLPTLFANDNTANYASTVTSPVTAFGTAGTGYPFIVGNIIILPSALKTFEATSVSTGNRLDWELEQPDRFKLFVLEESNNGIDFSYLSTITPGLWEAYNYIHLTDKSQTKYYRLKLIDLSGSITYSHVVSIGGKKQIHITLLQNPVQNQLLFRHPQAKDASYTITDFSGRKMLQGVISKNAAVSTISTSSLANGMYVLHYIDHGETLTATFLKQ